MSIASLHQFRNCLVPLLRPSACVVIFDAAGKTGSAAPALEIQSLVRTPSNRAIGCGELFLCEWTVVKQPFIRTTPNLNKSTGHPESRRAALAEKAKKNKSEAEASLMKN